MLPTSFDPSLLAYLTPQEAADLDALITSDPTPWRPLEGPQRMAYESEADIIGYGGAAGGGKTDLACGKALTRHRKAMMLRRVGTELPGIIDRLELARPIYQPTATYGHFGRAGDEDGSFTWERLDLVDLLRLGGHGGDDDDGHALCSWGPADVVNLTLERAGVAAGYRTA